MHRSRAWGLSPHCHGAQALGQGESRLLRAAHNEDCILAADRADDLGPALRVDRLGNRLGTAGQRVQDEQFAHSVDIVEKLR